jgi:hypothetical protein
MWQEFYDDSEKFTMKNLLDDGLGCVPEDGKCNRLWKGREGIENNQAHSNAYTPPQDIDLL